PDRFEERMGEAEVTQVPYRFLAQVVVDAEHRRLGEYRVQCAVERPRRSEVAPEGFFHHHARVARTSGRTERTDNGGEKRRRDGQVVQRPGVTGGIDFASQPGEGLL